MLVNVIHNKDDLKRKNLMLIQLERQEGIEYVFWPSIRGDIAEAHKQIIRVAMLNGEDFTCIAEDDIFFYAKDGFQYFMSKWDRTADIFLGGIYGGAGQFPNEGNVVRTHISGLHLYIVHQRAYQRFLNLNCENESLDNALSRASMEGKMKVVCCYPFAAAQQEMPSYNPLMKGQVNLHRFFFNSQNMYGYAGNGK